MDRMVETDYSFSSLYKYNGKNMEFSQSQRREKFLEEQKEKRHKNTDKHRQLSELFMKEININDENMEYEVIKPTENKFKFELMQSEWLTDIPDDLEENWLAKFSPQGFRVLLVARHHITILYNIQGRIISKIKSTFPGGGVTESNGITILDCILSKSMKTVFILDCLFWNSMSMLDSEVCFRFFWLKTKFEENPALNKCIKYNFVLLDCMPAERSLIQDKMSNLLSIGDNKFPFDGVVFYHKESHYTFGYTPLIGWLASYMLPEKLHIDVSPQNMVKKPKDYICMEKYLETLHIKKKKKGHKKIAEIQMEVQ